MKVFVNREPELKLIDESFRALLDKRLLLRTPILDVQGVGGIGKTSLLKQIEQRCKKTQLPYIWIEIGNGTSDISFEIITQVKRYIQDADNEPFLDSTPIYALKILLKKSPAVMLFDGVDSSDTIQMHFIENLLKELVDDERLFVVFASKKILTFQQNRSVARKLTTLSLKTLDRVHCDSYLETLNDQVDLEVRNLIFEWTRGYPIAMNVLAQAVQDGLDIRTPSGQQEALSLLAEQVINQEVLVSVNTVDRKRYFLTLQLFSVPRRFNLVIMQDLIETFTPEFKLESSIAYWSLPREITEATDVLNWNMARAGFSVDEPIRSLFLLLLKMEQPERYFSMHEFLAQNNLRLAKEVTGFDRVRYIRECLYHIACAVDTENTAVILKRLMEALSIMEQEPLDTLLQFSEEFSQDTELKEALGSHLATIEETISHYQPNIDADAEKG